MPNMGRYRITSSQIAAGSIMVVSQNVFLREADVERPSRGPAGSAFAFSRVMEWPPPFALSYLVPGFYKTDMGRVIISCCEFLSPVVLLAERDNFRLKSA